jgi:hypothetical protein
MVLEWVRTLALIAPLSEVLATARLATVGLVPAGPAKMKVGTAEELATAARVAETNRSVWMAETTGAKKAAEAGLRQERRRLISESLPLSGSARQIYGSILLQTA